MTVICRNEIERQPPHIQNYLPIEGIFPQQ